MNWPSLPLAAHGLLQATHFAAGPLVQLCEDQQDAFVSSINSFVTSAQEFQKFPNPTTESKFSFVQPLNLPARVESKIYLENKTTTMGFAKDNLPLLNAKHGPIQAKKNTLKATS